MGCGSSSLNRIDATALHPIRATVRIEGQDFTLVSPKVIHSTLTVALGDNDYRFDVQVTDDPKVYRVDIRPKIVTDGLNAIAEEKAIHMIFNQIRVRAVNGALYLSEGCCWIVEILQADNKEQLTDYREYYENILIKEAFTDAWLDIDSQRAEEVSPENFKKIVNWAKFDLNFSEEMTSELYKLLLQNHTKSGHIPITEFLGKMRNAIRVIYRPRPDTTTDWCKMWSRKSGYFYFNKRDGRCQFNQPTDL